MTHASLFSGIGGPEVAAAMLGWENAFHCEINPFGRQVLEYWFPDSVSYEDITKTNFKEWRGRIDVLTGGFPCQPFSYAGKRGGREDERYLWPEMLRAIDEIRPTWVVGENVAGLATMVEGGVLSDLGGYATLFQEGDDVHGYELEQTFTIERICRDLEHLGYSVQPVLIPAAAVGAPHRRDRIFICAHRDGDNLNGRIPQREIPRAEDPESAGYGTRLQHGERYDLRGVAANTDGGDDVRVPGEDAGSGRAERLQERDEIRLAGVAGELRPEIQRLAANADGHRRNEIHEHIQSRLADGTEPLGDGGKRHAADAADLGLPGAADSRAEAEVRGEMGQEGDCPQRRLSAAPAGGGRIAPHADGAGLQEPKQPGWRADSPEEGAGMDDRTLRPRGHEDFADAYYARLSAALQSGGYDEKERDDARRSAGMLANDAWTQGTWWDNFPTVAPIHAGNDGLPVRMDGAAIPFGRWRTEALKAYGNAIVPQVMYRIFQSIEETSK